jgi:dipeptidyl aminopeptidase/acylaminoacyl peptidase
MRLLHAVAALAVASSAGAVPAVSPSHVFEGKDIFSLQCVTDAQIRPDGHVVAYVRMSYDIMTDRPRRSIWLVDTETGAQTPLVTGPGSASSPRWSPDGKRLAYIASDDGRAQLFVRWMQTQQATPITDLTETPEDLEWSPDGRNIAFVMMTPDEKTNLGSPPPAPKAPGGLSR